ncbi:hypothetical protein PCANC_01370 [Puccinia coronata f. sp. avenae]|uniref:Uncharacterized protein n=1 Tax=Puccinia coronata f. sp. avenae TaxID=200324 RepID=A0A2N5W657_9BASI|nr:hypothetical protein PCANC_01370 [Puccinia coronata f. sp. avenae]
MGDIPDCALFRDPVLEKYLQPYFEIIEAAQVGNITKSEEALSTHSGRFLIKVAYTVIWRLGHNVIKSAL